MIPKFGGLTGTARRRVENEIRFGTWLQRKFEAERADTKRRMVAAALPYRNVLPRHPRSNFTLTGIIDARTYYRWLHTDPDFFKDKNNWKRFVRDNPEVQPWKT